MKEAACKEVKLIARTVFPQHAGTPEDVVVPTAPIWAACGNRWKALKSHFPYSVTRKSPGGEGFHLLCRRCGSDKEPGCAPQPASSTAVSLLDMLHKLQILHEQT